MTEHLKICFDKILPRDINRPHRALALGDPLRAILVIRKMWPNGSTLQVRFMGGTPQQQALAQEQAGWWSEYANLNFHFNDAADAQIRISFDPSDGAWSYVGTDCLNIPKNQATMNLGFQDGGTSGHEFGHAIGLGHEHQNPAGGIEWNEDVVIRDLAGPPNFWTPDKLVITSFENTASIRSMELDSTPIRLCCMHSPAVGPKLARVPTPTRCCRKWTWPLSPARWPILRVRLRIRLSPGYRHHRHSGQHWSARGRRYVQVYGDNL